MGSHQIFLIDNTVGDYMHYYGHVTSLSSRAVTLLMIFLGSFCNTGAWKLEVFRLKNPEH